MGYNDFPIQDEYLLLTHFPKSNELNFQILRPLGKWTWIASWFTLVAFLLPFSMFYVQHLKLIHNTYITPKVTFGKLALNVLLQYQQPAPLLDLVGKKTSVRILTVFISVMAIYWHTLYDVKVRSFIIGQTYEPIAEKLQDLDVSEYPIFNLDNDGLDTASTIVQVFYFI